MANDIDMWNDIKRLEKENNLQAQILIACFNARFIEGNLKRAETLKKLFIKEFGYWGKYY